MQQRRIFNKVCFLVCVATVWICVAEGVVSAGDETTVKGVPRGGCPDLIDLIKELTPVVVSISIERHMLQNSSATPATALKPHNGKLDERARGRERFQMDSLGSGFICDPAGYIVTNRHVVEGAVKILVTLSTGKVVTAKVAAIHPKVDLALLKISLPTPLQKAKIGDSSRIQVGEWVLAVGNPFGLGRSVTVGIVSGKERYLGLGAHDNFIQTDASINPGNSGGPLFNMAGEVVGVNTAIMAAGRGVGFSIPSNFITELMKLPPTAENADRGWLGIYVQEVTAQQARSLGWDTPKGTIVDEVLSSTPAYTSGLRKGDLIIEADSKSIRDGRHLSSIVAATRPGDLLRMTVLRSNKSHTIDVIMGRSPE